VFLVLFVCVKGITKSQFLVLRRCQKSVRFQPPFLQPVKHTHSTVDGRQSPCLPVNKIEVVMYLTIFVKYSNDMQNIYRDRVAAEGEFISRDFHVLLNIFHPKG
jgi:hypothetical protein